MVVEVYRLSGLETGCSGDVCAIGPMLYEEKELVCCGCIDKHVMEKK